MERDSDVDDSDLDWTDPEEGSLQPALAFSPRAILGGFALLAALLLLLLRRRGGK